MTALPSESEAGVPCCILTEDNAADALRGLFLPCSWDDFQAYVDEREPKMLRAFTSLEVNPAGQYDLKHIKSELPRLVLPLGPLHA